MRKTMVGFVGINKAEQSQQVTVFPIAKKHVPLNAFTRRHCLYSCSVRTQWTSATPRGMTPLTSSFTTAEIASWRLRHLKRLLRLTNEAVPGLVEPVSGTPKLGRKPHGCCHTNYPAVACFANSAVKSQPSHFHRFIRLQPWSSLDLEDSIPRTASLTWYLIKIYELNKLCKSI